MAKRLLRRVCACGCGRKFKQKYSTQTYLSRAHKNRAGQVRLRARAKEHGALVAALHGAED